MESLLKDIYNIDFFKELGEKIYNIYPEFHCEDFTSEVMAEPWESLSLKERMRRVTVTLGKYLPRGYEEALKVLFSLDESCSGLAYLFLPDFVEVFGQEEKHWEFSMKALESFTQKASSEFAIRPFILKDPKRVMNRMMRWTSHSSEHVRRLASEGCRPRLPWGMALPVFKKDPRLVLNVLEQLKEDPSIYVRKSVANNLNDISKDNPAVVLDAVRKWTGISPNTDWILRHGCRTLIRKGNKEALELFGYASFEDMGVHITEASISVEPVQVRIGESCELSYELNIPEGEPVHIRVEYAVDFIKANGKSSRKLFKLSDKTAAGGAHLAGSRTHSFANLTTRRHYPGEHRITLVVNGEEVAHTKLEVIVD